jgi:ABC-type Na+ efflux pump permease subunit
MYFPPVLQRELAVAARRKSTAWGRSLSAGIAFVVLLVLLIGTRGNSGSSGPLLLRFISLFVLLECLLAGARYTADCLSEEKREGTLGLLFLTPLTALEVVLGKLLARSLGAIYNLLAILPVFALSFLIGGVTGAQVFSTSVLLLVTVIFSLAAGLFVSSMGKNNHAVLMGAVALVAGFALLPPTFWKGLSSVFGYLEFWDILLYLSPAFGYNQALRGWRPEVRTPAGRCWH